MVQDPDAANPRSSVRIREPVLPGARAGVGQAGRSSDCTVHSAAALPSSAAATTSSGCRGRQSGLPGCQEHGRGTAAAFRDGSYGGLPGGAGFGHDRPGRLARFAGRTGYTIPEAV